MLLRELIAASIIAISPVSSLAHDDKPAPQEEDLDSLIKEAGRLYKQNNPFKPGVPSDREQAIPLLEKIVKRSDDERYRVILLQCRRLSASEKFNEAQRLYAFDPKQQPSIKKDYKVATKEQSREVTNQLYRDVIAQLKPVLDADPDTDPQEWRIKAICHARFGEWDEAVDGYRNFLIKNPDEIEAYKSLFVMYYEKKKVGLILDDLEKVKLDEKEKVAKLVQGIHAAYDEARDSKMITRVRAETKEDKIKAAKLFYLTSKTKWDEEMKKENYVDRDFSYPMHDAMRAGSFDLLAAENDEEREAAFKRFEQAYNPINKGMENSFGELSKYYKFITLTRKAVPIVDAEKVYELLQQKYNKK